MEPVETLLAHFRRENRHALGPQELGVERAAPAVVAGGGPDGLVDVHVELARHQPGGQAAEGGPDFMAARGEPLAHHGDNAAGHAGELRGQFNVVGDGLEEAAGLFGLVLPGDPEEVQGVHVPKAHGFQLVLDLAGDGFRVLHLGDGGDEDVVLPGLFQVVLQALAVDGEIDHTKFPPVCSCQYRNTGYTWKCRSISPPCRRTW